MKWRYLALMLLVGPMANGQNLLEETFLTLTYNNNQHGSILKRPVGDIQRFDAPSFSLGIEKYLSPFLNVSASLATGRIMNNGHNECSLTGLDLGLKYKLGRGTYLNPPKVNPYFSLGMGMRRFSSSNSAENATNSLALTPEIGLDINMSDRARLSVSAAYNTNAVVKYRTYSIGIGFSISKKKDKDRDGIRDKFDRCPETPGPSYNKGCPSPDRDKDGVIDALDVCPMVAGTLNGCPDSDGDGIADAEDTCPFEKGENGGGGCPIGEAVVAEIPEAAPALMQQELTAEDTDQDKVADAMDICPLLKGNLNNHGCPYFLTEQLLGKALSFEEGKAELSKELKSRLDQLAQLMLTAEFELFLTTRLNEPDSEKQDTPLSLERTSAIISYLIGMGISEHRISIRKEVQSANQVSEPVHNQLLLSLKHK